MALYWRVLGNQFLHFDDYVYLTNNDPVNRGLTWDGFRWAFTNFRTGNWHPLTWLSHMLDVEWFGLNAATHHFMNVLWHAANAVVLMIALWRLTGRLWRSALVAALFSLHPLRVESVAWAAERKDVLCAFFFFCMLWAYSSYSRSPRSWRLYAIVAAMLALALMAKSAAVTAPFLLLLLDYWPLHRKEPWKLLVREKLPLLAMVLAVCVAAYAGQKQVGAMTVMGTLTFSERLANAVVSYPRYLGKIFWPHPLAVVYPYPHSLTVAAVVASILLLAAITAAVLRFRRQYPYLIVGWFWFVGTMVPMIGIVQVGWQAYADRYTYISSIGLAIALVWMAADAVDVAQLRLAATASALVLAALATATWLQIPYWHDDMTLFQYAIASTSLNPLAEYQLGHELVQAGRNAEAIPHLEEATRGQPDFYGAYYLLGEAQAATGAAAAAIVNFSTALRLKPDYAEAYYARGATNFGQHTQDAERDFRAALHYGLSTEWSPDAHHALGVIAARRGDLPAAIVELEEAVRLRPKLVEAQRSLATALASEGRVTDAIAHLERSISANPGDPSLERMLAELQSRGRKPGER